MGFKKSVFLGEPVTLRSGFNLTELALEIKKRKKKPLHFLFFLIYLDSVYHSGPSNSSSFSIKKRTQRKWACAAPILSTEHF